MRHDQGRTRAVRAGIATGHEHGAVVPPLHLSSTFAFDGFGQKGRYDYTRSGNPTRDILGAAMASLHDHGSFTLGDWLPSAPTEHKDLQFRVDFNRMETSDLIRIWEAVQRPYRLSVSYVVRTARISSQLVQETPLVSQRNITLTQR